MTERKNCWVDEIGHDFSGESCQECARSICRCGACLPPEYFSAGHNWLMRLISEKFRESLVCKCKDQIRRMGRCEHEKAIRTRKEKLERVL